MAHPMPFLTIAIPTYNRRDHLKRRLKELVPQLTDDVSLCIFDNGSDDGTPEVVAPYGNAVTYSRSEVNLGMCRNFMRCFEETPGEWLWILGDDDPVQPNAIEKALALIRHCGDGIINFTTSCGNNPREETIANLDEFFESKDVTSVMYVSANFYERKAIKGSLKILAPAAFTVAPNVAIIIHALQAGTTRFHLSPVTLLIHEDNPRRWSGLEVSLGLSVFPEFITDLRLQRKAALGLRVSTRWMLLWGLVEVESRESIQRWKRVCRQTNANLAAYGGSLLPTLWHQQHSDQTLFRRELIIEILIRLPSIFAKSASQKMKKQNFSIFAIPFRDFN